MNISRPALSSNIVSSYFSSWKCVTVLKLREVAREKYRIHPLDEPSLTFSHLLHSLNVFKM